MWEIDKVLNYYLKLLKVVLFAIESLDELNPEKKFFAHHYVPRRSQSLNLKLNEELLGSETLWFSFDLLPNLSVLKWSRWSVFTRLGSNIPWILTVWLLLLLLIYGANNNCIYKFMSMLLTILHSVVKLSTGSLWAICLGLLCYLNLKLSLCALNNSLQITVFLDSTW